MSSGLEELRTFYFNVETVRGVDGASDVEEDTLFFFECFILDTTLITFDTPDCEDSLLGREEPGSLWIIGEEEPERH